MRWNSLFNGVAGQVQDLWIQGGKIVPPPSDPGVKPDATEQEIKAAAYRQLAKAPADEGYEEGFEGKYLETQKDEDAKGGESR